MRNILLKVFGLLSILSTISWALNAVTESVNVTSFTTTNDTTKVIPGSKPGTELMGVIVSSPSGGGGITLFDSSGTITSTLSIVTMATVQAPQYYVFVSSALSYTTTGNVGGVSIIYRNH